MSEKISQIKFDEKFIKNLLKKLKIENTRSIYLNAIPGRYARLDLFELSKIDGKINKQTTHEKFMDMLLSKSSFNFCISYDNVNLSELSEEGKSNLSLLSKKINKLVIENENNFLEFGIKNFGLGFPLLIKQDKNDPTKIIKAPIFIWHLDIEKSYRNKNKWIIKKNDDSPIKLNEVLVSHILKDESIELKKIPKEILEEGVLNKEELLNICKDILSQLGVKEKNLKFKIEKCPNRKTIDSITNSKPWIQWSGIFGIYSSQKETIIHTTEKLLKNYNNLENEKLILDDFQTYKISPIETDPSQKEIIHTLTKDEIKLIQGPPGTGKSQSITAIISNSLANKAKCLVVCEKKTALDVIKKNLDKIGLQNFSVIIDDVNKDRKEVIKKARAIVENIDIQNYISFQESDFKSKYENFCKIKDELNEKYKEASKPIFGKYNWKQIIGYYLRYSKLDNFKKISDTLTYDSFTFEYEEYLKYLNKIKEASYLYENINKDIENIFGKLNSELFNTRYTLNTHEKVRKNIDKYFDILNKIKEYLTKNNQNDCEYKKISIFEPNSIDESREIIEQIIKKLNQTKDLYQNGIKLIGEKFNKQNLLYNFSFSIYSVFSSKYKKICKIKEDLKNITNEINDKLKSIKKFDLPNFEIKKIEEYQSLKELNNDIKKLLEKISRIHSKIINIEKIKEKIEGFEKNLEEFNKDKIYNFEYIKYTRFKKYQNIVDYYLQLQIDIESIKKNIDFYESFHNWKFFESQCDKNEKIILQEFKKIPTKEREKVFNVWYYYGFILDYEKKSKVGFNKSDISDEKLKQLSNTLSNLKEQQIEQIKHIWLNERKLSLGSLNINFKTLYNLGKNKKYNRHNSLRKIIETDFNLFTNIFPVILTNPGVVNSIFPLKQGLFDIVIFDEASQLRIEDTFTSFIRGKYKIIAGDKHQMPPSNYFLSSYEKQSYENKDNEEIFTKDNEQQILSESESLLEYAENLQNINKSYLDFHYRSKHPDLIEFSNHAFYGSNLIPFPAIKEYKAIDFRNVNGIFKDERVNIEEINEIIKILMEEIQPDSKGKYPSIGIVTFNINQRDLIIETLNNIEDKDPNFAKKIQNFKKNGLFVKNLENVQGDERDIVIISTTYGRKIDGRFLQHFARLNSPEGYKLLNVLITRAKKKLYICTSIPRENYLKYSELIKSEGNSKKGIFYAYLAYAEAKSNNDNKTANNILNILKEKSFDDQRITSQNNGLSESPFEEEVYEELLHYFKEENIIQQYKIGGFRVDFLIKVNNKNIVLECDGKTYHQSEEAYAYDIHRQKILESQGYIVYRIWSTNWFQNKNREIKKFLQFTKKLVNK